MAKGMGKIKENQKYVQWKTFLDAYCKALNS